MSLENEFNFREKKSSLRDKDYVCASTGGMWIREGCRRTAGNALCSEGQSIQHTFECPGPAYPASCSLPFLPYPHPLSGALEPPAAPPDTLGFVWLWCLYAHCSLRLTSRSWLPGNHLLTCGGLPSSGSLSFLKLPEMELPCLHLPPPFPPESSVPTSLLHFVISPSLPRR